MKLHDQPLELLIALTERPGEILSRDELRRRLWPDDTFVDYDNSLNNALSRLRDSLEDEAATPHFIETVPKRGYRFIAAVRPASGPAPAAAPPRRAGRAAFVWALIAIAVTIAFATVWRNTRPLKPAAATRHRLMVLPLRNLTGDDSIGYVVDGLSEDLITHLGRLSPQRLAVIARTTASTYAGTNAPLSQIASELSVDHVVEGAVRRQQGHLRVTIRLVRASDQSQVWADMFERRRRRVIELL